MTSQPSHLPLPGSDRTLLPGARQVGAVHPDESIQVSIYLKPRSQPVAEQLNQPNYQPLSREEFANQHGADPDAIAKVEAFAREHQLTIVEVNPARRVVVVSGTAAQMNAAFKVDLNYYEHAEGTYRGRVGTLQVPAEIASIIDGVFGLDNRPQARAHFRRLEAEADIRASSTSYTPPQVAQLYNFPTKLDGSGQSIAIIELGGGYRQEDLDAYFKDLNIPQPKVVSVSVDQGSNSPSTANSADGEVQLDIQVVGAIAPGAQIVVYFAPNSDQGFIDAITTAIHDTQYHPSVISISWGAPEIGWTGQATQAMDQAFQAAAAVGVTVCCASGDNGSADGVTDDKAHVDFPASSPYALACGGTRLASEGGKVTDEVVWNEMPNGGSTGGGVSDVFDLPSWQANAGVPPSVNPGGRVGRGVPDVCGDADPTTGYIIRVDGQNYLFGGTSAVAPLWAALIALINQGLGKSIGYINPSLYQLWSQSGVLRDITEGNNGGYSAKPGWDACTGLGSPDGAKLFDLLQNSNNQGDFGKKPSS